MIGLDFLSYWFNPVTKMIVKRRLRFVMLGLAAGIALGLVWLAIEPRGLAGGDAADGSLKGDSGIETSDRRTTVGGENLKTPNPDLPPRKFDPTVSNTEFSPLDVVKTQLAALQQCHVDREFSDDDAMLTVYSLASPDNRLAIGTFRDFDRVVRSSGYAGLIGHRAAMCGSPVEVGDSTVVTVSVIDIADQMSAFEFVLEQYPCPAGETKSVAVRSERTATRESDPQPDPASLCWMTTAVFKLQISPLPEKSN